MTSPRRAVSAQGAVLVNISFAAFSPRPHGDLWHFTSPVCRPESLPRGTEQLVGALGCEVSLVPLNPGLFELFPLLI